MNYDILFESKPKNCLKKLRIIKTAKAVPSLPYRQQNGKSSINSQSARGAAGAMFALSIEYRMDKKALANSVLTTEARKSVGTSRAEGRAGAVFVSPFKKLTG